MTVVRPAYWLYAFLFIHLLVWTLAPFSARFTLPMDTIEGAIWGHQLAFGYDKNPFMNAFLTLIATRLGGTSGWLIYLFSQLSVVICLWSVWQLGKKMLPPLYALIGVMALEGMQYTNLHAFDLNDNTLELSFWALTILFFYQALTEKKYRDWILTGLFAGFAMMTKYYSAILLFAMFLFLFTEKKIFKNPGLYWGFLVFLIVIMPHVVWLFSHDFITVRYMFNRIDSLPLWTNHLFYPTEFAWQQIQVAIPAVLLLLILFIGKKPEKNTFSPLSHFNTTFLFFVGVLPFLLTILLSFLTGIKLRAAWGQPLLFLWGIFFLYLLKPQLTLMRFYRFSIGVYTFLFTLAIVYCIELIRAEKPSSASYPGQLIASTLTQMWQDTYHKPLQFVAGSRWLAGNIAYYSADHPAVYINWDKRVSFWIDEKKLRKEGAIFVWDPDEDKQASIQAIQTRFKNMGKIHVIYFTWMRNKSMPPVQVTAAFLPPL